MKLVKVGVACLNQTPLDWNRNQANIRTAIRRARAEGVSLLLLPEMAVTGGTARFNKKFTVGFDRAGNIVHLYGNDVPSEQRRQVIKRRPA